METVRPICEKKGIALQVDLSSSVPWIEADPLRLQQVFWNLLNNAAKFTNRGGKITVTLDQVDHGVRVRLKDTGKGIAPEFMSQIFNPFAQADSSPTRIAGGIGLGLALVRNLVELHHGTVEVESPGLGKGATFTVFLPGLPREASTSSS